MTKPLPWGINHISDVVHPRHTAPQTEVTAQSATGRPVRWIVQAIPEPYYTFGIERLRAAWWVLTGKAHAFVWPKAGEFELAYFGRPSDPRELTAEEIKDREFLAGQQWTPEQRRRFRERHEARQAQWPTRRLTPIMPEDRLDPPETIEELERFLDQQQLNEEDRQRWSDRLRAWSPEQRRQFRKRFEEAMRGKPNWPPRTAADEGAGG